MSSLNYTSEALRKALFECLQEAAEHSAAQMQYPDPEYTVQDVPARLLGACSVIVSEFFQERNRRAPTSRLPSELLAAAFAFVPIPDRLFLGRVCHAWNTTLHSHPGIWSHIEYTGDFGVSGALERILAMSAQSDLHLDVTLTNRTLEETAAAISRHLHHCVTLRLVAQRDLGPFNQASEALTAAISQPAPRLVAFRLLDHTGAFNPDRLDSVALFSNDAPRLELVKILCDVGAIRSSVETFRGVRRVMYSPREEIAREDIQQLIWLCPDVEELSIDFDYWESDSDEDANEANEDAAGSTPPLVLPQRLNTLLILPNATGADPARFLSVVDTTSIPEVSVSYNLPAIHDQDRLILGQLHALHVPTGPPGTASTHPFIARTISFESSTFSERSIHIYMFETEMDVFRLVPQGTRLTDNERVRPGVERSILDLGYQTPLEPACFAHVVRLQMTEMVFDPDVIGAPLPDCPALVHLTVYLMARSEHAEARFISGFISAGSWPNRVLVCPRLETFRIGVDAWDRGVRMEPSAVTEFVKNRLRYEKYVLMKLFFNGVDIHVGDPQEFEDMLRLADDVVWDRRHISWSFKHSDLMDWR